MITSPALIQSMADAASALINVLSQEQCLKACFAFDNDEERHKWFYTPTPREGLRLGEMSPNQQQHVMRLVSTGLSEAGYNYACLLMGSERMVDRFQNFPDRTYGNLPNTRLRDPANYSLGIFGSPGASSGWSWRLGGHHLNLHFTIRNGTISATPAFFGAEPARAIMPGGIYLRPLAAEEDKARELLKLFSAEQLSQAIIAPVAPTDIVQMNRPRIEDGALPVIGGAGPGGEHLRSALGLTPELDEMVRYSHTPKGIPAANMSSGQTGVFVSLINVYLDHLSEAIQESYRWCQEPEKIQATTFAWAGPLEIGAPHYYRVQSPWFLIEYDCTQNEANHTHSVLRNLAGDFGDDPLAAHYALDHAER
jgi:hypothetical protein